MSAPKKRERDRGVPPPAKFDLYALPDNAELRPQDVSAWRRETLSYTERKRREKTDGLEWKIVGHRPRTTAGSLKAALRAVTVEGNIVRDQKTSKPDKPVKRSMRADREGIGA